MTVTDAELDAACQSFWEPGLYKFRDTMRRALEAAAAARPSEEMAATLAIWRIRKHSDPASVDSSTLARAALEAAATVPRRPGATGGERMKRWYIGAQNDALFIIDEPPRPSTDDIVDIPNVSVIAGPLESADAERIVTAWNMAVDENVRLRAAIAAAEGGGG